ncbi:hypothetical protein ABTN07_20140, partial [Acinetobacter baumannii]
YVNNQQQLVKNETDFDVLGNKAGGYSLFELFSKDILTEKLTALSKNYDIIIIESPSLQKLNKAKEWITLADKVVCVFEANHAVRLKKQT